MIGCITAISPCVKSASAKLFLDLHTVSDSSADAHSSAHVECISTGRNALRYASAASAAHSRVYRVGAPLKRRCQKPQRDARERLHSRSAIRSTLPRIYSCSGV